MRFFLGLIFAMTWRVAAYPHDRSGHEVTRNKNSFARSVDECQTPIRCSIWGGRATPSYTDVGAYKIGTSFHPQTAIVAQLKVKYTYSRRKGEFEAAFGNSIDVNLTAYKGMPGSDCERRVMIGPGFKSQLSSPNSMKATLFRQDPAASVDSSLFDFNTKFAASLYNAYIWKSLSPNDPTVILWPYKIEMQYFGFCQTPWCTSAEASLAMYKAELKFDGLVMDNVIDQKWTSEAFNRALDTCNKTPVIFTSTIKTTNPAWIVSRKEGDGWRMDMVRSIDEEEQSVVYTLEDIISKVLPDYPDLVHVKVPVAAEKQ